MADWSMLPSDLLTNIANCLLATNDVDCYMDFRAVCTSWRSATDDPKDSSELRFRPRRWIIIDEVFQTETRLMVNTVSGRVVRKELPLLRRFYVVSTTHGGFFVLADRELPHAACVLNPLTGHLIRFVAPVPSEVDVAVAVVGSSPTIIVLSDRTWMHHLADPESEWFTVHQHIEEYYEPDTYPMNRLAFLGGMYASGERVSVALISVGLARKISDLMTMLAVEPSKACPTFLLLDRCFIVEFDGDVFIIFILQNHMVVYKLDTDNEVLEPMKSIGSLAIFAGYRRCFIVDSEKFPSIAANCIYYVESTDSCAGIYKYDLKEDKKEMLSEAIHSIQIPASSTPGIRYVWNSVSRATPLNSPIQPFTLVQLLSSYTTNVRPSELEVEDIYRYWSGRSDDELLYCLGDDDLFY